MESGPPIISANSPSTLWCIASGPIDFQVSSLPKHYTLQKPMVNLFFLYTGRKALSNSNIPKNYSSNSQCTLLPFQSQAEDTKIGLAEMSRTLVSTGVGNKLSRWFVKQTNKKTLSIYSMKLFIYKDNLLQSLRPDV